MNAFRRRPIYEVDLPLVRFMSLRIEFVSAYQMHTAYGGRALLTLNVSHILEHDRDEPEDKSMRFRVYERYDGRPPTQLVVSRTLRPVLTGLRLSNGRSFWQRLDTLCRDDMRCSEIDTQMIEQ